MSWSGRWAGMVNTVTRLVLLELTKESGSSESVISN